MQPHYSPEFPLGFNANYRSPAIPFYLSWDEVAEITRTGIIPDADGKKYLMADQKEDRPLITYKGDFDNRRCNDTFTGTRSPYIAIDIDIDQNVSGLNKYDLTDEQRGKVESDREVMLNFLSSDKRDFFFCKSSTSRCGLHIIVKLEGVPDGKMPLYEREVINQFNKALKEITGIYYKYTADPAMMKLGQALGLSKDENVIYNPGRVTPVSMYNPTPEYEEQEEGITYHQRPPHRFDRLNFIRFGTFCQKEQKRLPYEDIFRLSLIFLLLWPDASAANYVEICSGLNEARAKEQGENSVKFLLNEYKKVKKAANKTYKSTPIGINSLYYIMDKYGYTYQPDKELRFKGYLQNVEPEIREVFNTHEYVLLGAPTGSGKTRTMFDYLKEEARKNPAKNYVLALPYKSMATQFANENSDDEFEIGLLSGDEEADKNFSKIKKKQKKKPKKKKPKKETIVVPPKSDGEKKLLPEKKRNLWCSTYDSAIRIWNIHTLVVDESHNMVAQVEFRTEAMEALASIRCKKHIIITATPEKLLPETLEGIFYVRCIKEDAVKPKLRIERVKGSLAVAAKNNIVGKSSSLTFWNHKPECERLRDVLLTEGVTAELYNRDTSEHAHQIKLKKEGLIGTHALATCYISEGINVLNDDIAVINIVDDYCITNIRQAAARPRKCVPEIKLILRETEYKPGSWIFSPVREFINELARLEDIAKKTTEFIDRDELRLFMNENLYTSFEDDESFLYWDDYAQRYQLREDRYWVRENRVKAATMERYKNWLYHKKRELWMAELSQYFEIVEITVTENTGKNEKKEALSFDAFKNASHELIMAFREHKIKTRDGRRRKKEQYTPEMLNWAMEHNHIELTKEWERWTNRYVKMWKYNAIDYDAIESGQKFCYWQRRADVLVSFREGANTAKEVRISETTKEVVNFLINCDFSSGVITKSWLYHMVKHHLSSKRLKPLKLKERPFWNSLKHVLKVELKQKRSTGKRFVKSITLITDHVAYSTGKLERQATEAIRDKEMELFYSTF